MWRIQSMNIKKLIEKIADNWAAKVICFALAVFVYIFHQISLLDKKTFSVPLKIESEGLLTPAAKLPPFVRVTVRAAADSMAAITAAGIKAFVYLDEYTDAGIYSVPVSVQLSPELLLLEPLEISVKPEMLHVELDEKIQKYIPVEPSVSGEVEKGYTISFVEVVPSSVKVIGPSRIVNKMKRVYTEKVNVKGASKGFSQEIALDTTVNQLVRPVPESQFKVTVGVEPELGEKKVDRITPVLKNLDPRFRAEFTVPSVSFTVSGIVTVLEKYKPLESSVYIDCIAVSAPGTYELPLVYSVPSPLSVTEKSLSSVSVLISGNDELSEEESGTENSEDIPDEEPENQEAESGADNGQQAVQETEDIS